MFANHLFWANVILLFWSLLNINAFNNYTGSDKLIKISIGVVGLFGFLSSIKRGITYSINFDWWWLIVMLFVTLISIGVFSFLYRGKTTIILAILGVFMIPLIWWSSSSYGSNISFEWFYSIGPTIRNFFYG